jgi:hypothetical protein
LAYIKSNLYRSGTLTAARELSECKFHKYRRSDGTKVALNQQRKGNEDLEARTGFFIRKRIISAFKSGVFRDTISHKIHDKYS